MKPAKEAAADVYDKNCAPSHLHLTSSKMVKLLADTITQARREGAEDMRERAADAFEDFQLPLVTNIDNHPKEATVSEAIRALPLDQAD